MEAGSYNSRVSSFLPRFSQEFAFIGLCRPILNFARDLSERERNHSVTFATPKNWLRTL